MAPNLFGLMFNSLLALGLGGLIGIERERTKHGYPAGVRTLAFLSLIGMLTSLIAETTSNTLVYPAALIGVILMIGASYSVSLTKKKSFGFTNTIIILLTFLIGLISYFNEYLILAVALSIITTLLLTTKKTIHGFARRMKDEELLDALKFGIVAFIILPLLPNQTIDPWNVINPWELWLMVVLILAISFIGYIAAKIVGPRKGLYWSGMLGGLVSSTAVSSSLSITSKKNNKLATACSVGITLASSIMFLRVLIEAYLFNPKLAVNLIMPLTIPAVIGFITSYLLWKAKNDTTRTELVEKSPFNFIPALKFTLLLVLIFLISTLGNTYFGDSGTYLTSILAGLVDTDAITLSMASLAGDSLTYSTAGTAILLACITNTIVKLFITWSVGSRELFKKMLLNYGIMMLPLIIFILLIF